MRGRKLVLSLALALLSAASVGSAAVARYQYDHTDPRLPSTRIPQFVLCDREAELPVVDVSWGDLAYAKDSGKLFKRTTASWVEIGAGSGVTDHGALTGLADDDHPQYAPKATPTFTGQVLITNGNFFTTGTGYGHYAYGTGVPTDANSAWMGFYHLGAAGGAWLVVGKAGTGTYESLHIKTGGADALVLDTSRNATFTGWIAAPSVTLGGVDLQTTLNAKVPTSRTISTTAPLAGGGDLSADRTFSIASFAGSTPGAVPTSAGGTTNFLRADGGWAAPPSGGSPPTGTGFRHITTGTEDAAAKLVENVDVAAAAGIVESKLALNNATHSNANDPSAGEKAALAGTSGAPSVTNKYVTDADARNANARTPTAHQLDGALHAVSGLTAGHFLKATGATTFGFAAHGLGYSDVGADAAGAAATVAGNLSTHTGLTTTAHGGIVASTDSRLTDARTPVAHAVNASTYGYGDGTNAGHLRVGTGLGVTTGTISVTYGTGAGTAAIGNDARLSDARTPTAHTHAEGDVTSLVTDLAAKVVVGGQIGGTASSPDVRGVRETTGPTLLTLGAIADGDYLKRVGGTVVGSASTGGVTVHNDLTGRSTADAHPAAAITNTAAGGIVAGNVQDAINELDTEKVNRAGDTMNGMLTIHNAAAGVAPLLLEDGDQASGVGNTTQIRFGYANADQYQHYLTTRHNSTAAGNSYNFYTSDGTLNGVYPTNAVLGLTIENGRITSPALTLGATDLQTTLNLKAPLANPTFTGVPAAPTAAVGTSTTQLATTAFVDAEAVAKSGDTMTGKLTVQLATEQLRLGYDVSNYWKGIVDAAGNIVLTGVGTAPSFTFAPGSVLGDSGAGGLIDLSLANAASTAYIRFGRDGAGSGWDRSIRLVSGGFVMFYGPDGVLRPPSITAAGPITTTSGFAHYAYGVGVPGDANTEFIQIDHFTGSGGARFIVGKTGTGAYRDLHFNVGGLDALAIDTSGNALSVGSIKSSSSTGGVGYSTGAGGAVTQLTSKATTVVLAKLCGTITTHTAALAASAVVAFTVTDSSVAATDVVYVQHDSGGTLGSYIVVANTMAAGSFKIGIKNISAGSLSEAIVIRFVVIKAVVS